MVHTGVNVGAWISGPRPDILSSDGSLRHGHPRNAHWRVWRPNPDVANLSFDDLVGKQVAPGGLSVFAVLRLIVRANLVGCSTGSLPVQIRYKNGRER